MLGARAGLVAVLFAALAAAQPISQSDYRARRELLRTRLVDGVTVLIGVDTGQEDALRSGVFQEPDFYYLTGWKEPGAILMLVPRPPVGTGRSTENEILFLPPHNPARERYEGRHTSAKDPDAAAKSGFALVLPVESFEARLFEALQANPKLYALTSTPSGQKLKAMHPFREVLDAADAIGRLRLKKSPAEVELIRRSVAASVEAHRAAWRRIQPGLYEFQVAATIIGEYLDRGCERSAFTPIVASGQDGAVLHYSANSRLINPGELVLIDAGAECSGYAADITRTVPVSGKFSPRQLELYRAVLGAQRAVLQAVKPGMVFDREAPNSLTKIAVDYLDSHGKDNAGKPLGARLTHLVGHHVGLEVHDAGPLLTAGPLEEGMVITVEPGIYLEEEAIGIRIEDMVLVTKDGGDVLTGSLPKEPEEIEKALSR